MRLSSSAKFALLKRSAAFFTLVVTTGLAQTNPPVITSSTNTLGTVGQPFGFVITASGNPTNFVAAGLPAGFVTPQTNTNGVISGLPQVAGVFTSTVTAANSNGMASNNLFITINPPAAPVLASPVTVFGVQGQPLSYALRSSPSHSNVPTTFSVSGLPSGSTLISNVTTNSVYTNVLVTNYFINSPSLLTNGSFVVPVVVSNQAGSSTSNVTFIINPSNAPVFTSAGTVTATVGVPFNYDVTAINSPLRFRVTSIQIGANPPVTGLSITNGVLTNGLSFSNVANGSTVVGRIFGTPGATNAITLGLEAANNFGTAATNMVINIGYPTPTVILSQPLGEGNYVNGSSFYLNAQVFDEPEDILVPSSYQFQESGVALPGSVGILGDYFGLEYDPAANPSTITASGQNALGQTSVSVGFVMGGVNPQAPMPSIEMLPLNFGQQLVAGGKVVLSARATIPSATTTIQRVEFYVNKVYVGSSTAPEPNTEGVYEYEWTTPATPGSFQVTARAVSLNFTQPIVNIPWWASVIARKPTIVNTKQGTAPSVAITAPANNGTLAVGVPNRIQATALLSGGSIDSVEFFANGRRIIPGPGSTATANPDTSVPFEVDFTPNSFGAYEIYAIATGSNGLQTVSPVVIANAPSGFTPTVSITTPKDGLEVPQGPLAIGWTSNDVDGSVQSVQILVNGASLGAAQTAGSGFTVFNPTSQGQYVFVARATDNQGNVTDSAPVTVTIDNTATSPNPLVVLDQRTIADQGYVYGSQAYFNATATPQGTNTIPTNGVSFLLGSDRQLDAFPGGIQSGGQEVYSAGYTFNSGSPTTIVGQAEDSAGNTGLSEFSTLYYGSPFSPLPTVDMLALPPSSQTVAGGTIQLRAKASFPISQFNQGATNTSRVEFYANGVFLGIGTANTNSANTSVFSHSFDWVMPTNTNSFRLTARAVQLNYNVPVTENAVIPFYGATFSPQIITANTFSNAAPTISITNPSTNGLQIGVGTTQQILASVTTATNASVKEVQWYVDGLLVTNNTTFSYTYNFAPTNTGLYNIAAVVVDSFGLLGSSEVRTVNATSGNAPTSFLTTSTSASATATVSGGQINTPLTITRAGSGYTIAPEVRFVGGGGSNAVASATIANGAVTNIAVSPRGSGYTSAPTVVIDPPPVAVGSNSTVLLQAAAADTDGTIRQVDFLQNGVIVGTATNAPYNFTLPVTAAGRYELLARATDNLGNVTDSPVIALSGVNGTPPTASFTLSQVGIGQETPVDSPELSVRAHGSNLVFEFLRMPGVIYTVEERANLLTGDWTPKTGVVFTRSDPQPSGLQEGYEMAEFAVPISGNSRFYRLSYEEIVTDPSMVSLNQTVSIQATASGGSGSVSLVQLLVNGLVVDQLTAGPYNFTRQMTNSGRHEFVVRVIDNLGNVTDTAPQTITVSAGAAPIVSITTPSNGLVVPQTPLTVSWNASDSDGSVDSVQLLVNGAAFGAPSTSGSGAVVYTPSSAGTYVFVARAIDNLGNVTDSAPVTVTIDNTVANPLPDVNLLLQTINQNNLVVGSQFYFNATAAATTNTTISNVSFSVITSSGLREISATNSQIKFGINNIYSAAYALTPVNLTTSTAFAAAEDSATNTGTSSAFSWSTFPARQSLPLVEVLTNTLPSAPTNPVAGGVVQLRAKAVFPGRSPTDGDVQFYANGALIGTALTNSNTGTLSQFTHELEWASPTNATNFTITARAIGLNYTVTVGTNTISYFGSSLSPNSRSINFTNGSPPSVSITTPATNNTVVGVGISNAITATATAASNASIREVQFFLDGIFQASVTNFPYTYNFTPASPGLYNFAAVAIDSFGLQNSSDVRTIRVTNGNAPSSFLTTSTSARATATVSGGQINTPLTITRAGSGYSTAPEVRFVGGGGSNAVASATITNGAVTNIAVSPRGSGYTSTPTVVIDPPPVAVGSNSTVLLQAAAADTDGTIRQVDFLQNGAIVGTVTNSPYNFSLPVTAPGRYELVARATDNLGNVTDSPFIVINGVTGAAPSVLITTPPDGLVTPQTILSIGWRAADADGSVERAQLLVNGVENVVIDRAAVPTSNPGSNVVTYTPPSQGKYIFVVRVTDNLGNVTDSSPVTVTVDNTATNPLPNVSLTQPLGVSYVAVGSEYYAAASALPSPPKTIDTVSFYLNGQLVANPTSRYGSLYASPFIVTERKPFDFTTTTFNQTALGGNEIFAEAKDSAGLLNASPVYRIASYGARNPLPTVEMLQLYGGANTVSVGGKVILQARPNFPTAANQDPVVEFYANGVSIGLGTKNASNNDYSLEWSPAENGPFVITARAQAVNWRSTSNFDEVINGTAVVGSSISDNFITLNTAPGVAPNVTITSPASGASLPINTSISIQATAVVPSGGQGAIERVEFYQNGILIGAPDTQAPFQVEFTPPSPGTYTLIAVAYGTSGLIGSSTTVQFSAVSGNAPTSFLTTSTSATATATVSGGQINTPLTITRAGSGYATAPEVRFVGGGGSNAVASATITNGAVTNIAVSPRGSGYTSAPTVVIDPPPVAVGSNSTVLLQAAAADTDGTIRQVDFLQNGAIVGTVTNSPYNFSLPVTAPGRYELVARATDNLGNVTDSPFIVMSAQSGASPLVNITDPSTGDTVTPGVPVTVTANASDSDGSVVRVDLLVNGVVVGTDTQAPYVFADAGQFSTDTNTTFTPSSEGQYVIVARAVDNAGNTTDSVPVTVTATAPPVGAPTVQMTQPLGEIYYVDGSSYFLNARITDAPPGTIDTNSVKFTVNGLPVSGSSLGRIANDYGVLYRPTNLFGIDATRAEALDNEGNRGISQPNYTVLTIPQYPLPAVEMLPLLPNTPTNAGGTVRLRAEAFFPSTASAEARVEFYANNVYVGTASNDPTDAAVFVYDWKTPTNQAGYVVNARAVARNFQTAVGEGNVIRFFGSIVSDNPTAVNTIPGVSPTVSIFQPTNGQTVNVNQPLNIRAYATNSAGTIGRVEFYANGQLVGVDTNAVYEADFTPPSTGLYNLAAIAYTESGILKVSETVTVNSVLGSPPTVTLQAPATAAVGESATLSAVATPVGDGRNIEKVEFVVNNIVVATDTAYPFQYEWPVQSPGNYQIQARATDNVGNVGLSSVATLETFYAPVVTLTASPTTVRQGETVRLRSRAFTDEAGESIANVLFATGNGTPLPSPGANGGPNPVTTTNSSGFYDYFYTATQPGVISLQAIATDTAGNEGDSDLVQITVEADASVPIINITSPAAGSLVEMNIPLLITAGASPGQGATITSVQFRVVDPDGILTTLPATQTESPFSVSYTGVTKPGFYNITAQVFNSLGKSNISNVVVEAVSFPPPPPGTNAAFVYDMFRLLFYRAATPLESDYWNEWLNEQTPGDVLASPSVRAEMVITLMGFNSGGGVFTQSSGPRTSQVASYQATSGTALQPYGRLGITPSRALVQEFLADILADVSENPPSGRLLPITGTYAGIPGAPYGATYGMAGGMQSVFSSTPFQTAYPGITSLDNNAFTLWLMNTMFQGRALGDGVAVRNMMNSFVPQTDRQGAGAAFFTRLEDTIVGNYSYLDPSGTALEKAFQLQVNSAALRFQLQGSAPRFWNYTTAPAYSQSVVENYILLYWDDVQ